MVSGPIPGLLSVTVCAVPVPFSASDRRSSGSAVSASAFGAITVAVIDTCCGLPAALSCKVRTADTFPTWLGHKFTVILQVLPGARADMHPPS